MAGKIKLTPEQLLEQSAEMASLQKEYEALFSQVAKSLNGLNENWSEALAGNFSGKIAAAQKAFSNVADMLGNGATATRMAATTYTNPGAIWARLNATDNAIDTMNDIWKNLGTAPLTADWMSDIMKKGVDPDLFLGELSKLTGMDAACAKDVLEKMAAGDYEGAIQAAAEKGLDWVSSAMVGGVPSDSLLGQLQELTGSDLGLEGLEKAYFKNLFGNPLENAYNIVKDQYSGDPDPYDQLGQLGELAWNIGPGAVIETCGDAAFDVIQKIPGIGEYYAQQGVTDGEGAIGAMIGEITRMVTGDSEAAAADANYYAQHGGIAGGIVDGVVDIGGFAAEKIGALWHSALGH